MKQDGGMDLVWYLIYEKAILWIKTKLLLQLTENLEKWKLFKIILEIKSLPQALVSHEESFWLFGKETKYKENIANEYWGTIFLLHCKLLKKLISHVAAASEDIWQIGEFVPAGPLTGHLR